LFFFASFYPNEFVLLIIGGSRKVSEGGLACHALASRLAVALSEGWLATAEDLQSMSAAMISGLEDWCCLVPVLE
jgi:hypothetical protein